MLMWFVLEHIGHNTSTVKICVVVAAGCVSFLGTFSDFTCVSAAADCVHSIVSSSDGVEIVLRSTISLVR